MTISLHCATKSLKIKFQEVAIMSVIPRGEKEKASHCGGLFLHYRPANLSRNGGKSTYSLSLDINAENGIKQLYASPDKHPDV